MKKDSIIKKNILQYLDIKGISKYECYKKTGISNGILSQPNGMSEQNLMKFLSAYPAVNPAWLLTGRGGMCREEAPQWVEEEGETSKQAGAYRCTYTKRYKTSHTEFPAVLTEKGIPLIPVDAMAGWGTGDVQVMDYEMQRYVVPEFHESKADFVIRVQGESMYPTYMSGDVVACKKLPLDTFFQWHAVYVLDTVQGAMVKRIGPSDSEAHIQCISDNADYKPFDLHLEELYALAIVLGLIRLTN